MVEHLRLFHGIVIAGLSDDEAYAIHDVDTDNDLDMLRHHDDGDRDVLPRPFHAPENRDCPERLDMLL